MNACLLVVRIAAGRRNGKLSRLGVIHECIDFGIFIQVFHPLCTELILTEAAWYLMMMGRIRIDMVSEIITYHMWICSHKTQECIGKIHFSDLLI